MKLKVSEIVDACMATPPDVSPVAKLNSPELPIAVSMKLVEITDLLEPITQEFQRRGKSIFDKYAVLSEPGKKDKDKDNKRKKEVPPKLVKKFNAELKVFLDEELELDIEPLSSAELEGVIISSSELKRVKWLISR